MFNALFVYVKYPSTAGVIAAIWIGSGILILIDRSLPILAIVELNIVVSLLIAIVGFRTDKR